MSLLASQRYMGDSVEPVNMQCGLTRPTCASQAKQGGHWPGSLCTCRFHARQVQEGGARRHHAGHHSDLSPLQTYVPPQHSGQAAPRWPT